MQSNVEKGDKDIIVCFMNIHFLNLKGNQIGLLNSLSMYYLVRVKSVMTEQWFSLVCIINLPMSITFDCSGRVTP